MGDVARAARTELTEAIAVLRRAADEMALFVGLQGLTCKQARQIRQAQAHTESALFLLGAAQDSLAQSTADPHHGKERIIT